MHYIFSSSQLHSSFSIYSTRFTATSGQERDEPLLSKDGYPFFSKTEKGEETGTTVPSSHQPAERADAARHNNASDNSRESEVATQSSQNRPLASPARASSPSNEAEQARSGEEQAVPRHAESKVQVGVTSSEAPPSHPVVVFDNVEDDNTNLTDVITSTAGETHTGASGDEVKRHSASGTPEQKNKKGTGEKAKRPKHIC